MTWNDVNRITLNGDMTMAGVNEQFHLLEQYNASHAEIAAPGCDQHPPCEFDLTGVQELDACGCQLLAAFLHDFRRQGIAEFSFKLSDAIRTKIHNLGFDDEIFNGGYL